MRGTWPPRSPRGPAFSVHTAHDPDLIPAALAEVGLPADVAKKFEFKSTCDDPAKVTISSVKYRIGTVPYTQEANVKLSDTNITTTDTESGDAK